MQIDVFYHLVIAKLVMHGRGRTRGGGGPWIVALIEVALIECGRQLGWNPASNSEAGRAQF